MEPISAALMAAAALAGTAVTSGWQGLSAQTQMMNMELARRNAKKQETRGEASRVDAYGNRTRFNPVTNEWTTDLAPDQERLVKAGEAEQLKSLTEDAHRNRTIKKAAASRGMTAGQDYYKNLSEFRNLKPASEDAIKGELTQLLAGVTESAGRKGNAEAIRQSIRQGGKSTAIPALINASDEDMGGALAENLLKARTGAVSEKATRDSAHSAKYLPLIQQLAQIMDLGGDAPQRFTDSPQMTEARQGQSASGLLAALTAGSNLENTANTNAAKTFMAGGPDLRGLASLMSGRSGAWGQPASRTQASETNGTAGSANGGYPSTTESLGWNPDTSWLNGSNNQWATERDLF